MKPSELFGVVVRSVGLLLTLSAMWCIFWAIVNGVFGGPNNTLGLLIAGVLVLLVGVWLLMGASDLAEAVYPKRPDKD